MKKLFGLFDYRIKYILHLILILAVLLIGYLIEVKLNFSIITMLVSFLLLFYFFDNVLEYLLEV